MTLLEKDPLVEAAHLVALLSTHAGAFMETHLMAFDVAVKRGKFLLAARAVIRFVWEMFWVFFIVCLFFCAFFPLVFFVICLCVFSPRFFPF